MPDEAAIGRLGGQMFVTTESVRRLTDPQRSEVLALVKNATQIDKVAPLSEQVLMNTRDDHDATNTNTWHLLAHAGTHLAGYAHLDQGVEAATAEIVVDPSSRRKGLGTALIHALENAVVPPATTLRLWSHGDLDAAHTLARRDGYLILRELWQMRRPLRSNASGLPTVSIPQGFSSRHFVVGRDEEAWLKVNAAAFVDHPEQGRMSRHDLDQRIVEPWFDASGFILIEDTRGPDAVLVASHWTKVVPTQDPHLPAEGEVYVVGVNPEYQGRGFGRTVTVLGLAHLRDKGLAQAMLYVDADNHPAVATYSRLDFARSGVDIMYERTVQPPV
jgi:mycothiol synthase